MSTIAVSPIRPVARRPRSAAGVTSTAPAMRLTRRGRLVFLLLFVALAFAALSLLSGHSAATDQPGAPVPTRTVQVHAGDTLWEIAGTMVEPSEDVRSVIGRIKDMNGLSSSSIQQGQVLLLPTA